MDSMIGLTRRGKYQAMILLSRHGGIMTYLFIARFARCALIGARRCSSANRRAAFTSLADSDPWHLEARASRVRQHNKLLRGYTRVWAVLLSLRPRAEVGLHGLSHGAQATSHGSLDPVRLAALPGLPQ